MTITPRVFWQRAVFAIAAAGAAGLAIYRAATQAITLDEAMTYLWYVAGLEGNHLWTPFPNNHLLNSLLIWVSTQVLGTSDLTVRLPALLGGMLYIGACWFLCRNLTDRFSLGFPLFICLVYNPFILDFLVVARGYSLATGFLLAAVAIPVWHRAGGPSLGTSCALASTALGLSFVAEFPFALIDLSAFLMLVVWALGRRGEGSAVRILCACVLPGLLVALLIAGYTLSQWPRGELNYGAQTLGEMGDSLIDPSLRQLNLRFQNPKWDQRATGLTPLVLPILVSFCLLQLVVTVLDGSWRRDLWSRWLAKYGIGLAGMVALTLALHWLLFQWLELPLPKSRTGIYLLPLCTLIAGVIAASPALSLFSRWVRRGTTAAFVFLAVYFLLCLRVGYFDEYQWDADLKDVYSVLAELNHKGVATVEANGLFHASLDFYRRLSSTENFTEFAVMGAEPAAGKAAYVLQVPQHEGFIVSEGLRIVYRGKSTGVVVAVR